MAFTPYAGTTGRIRSKVGSAAVANVNGGTAWKFNQQLETVPITNFESTADSNNIVWKQILAGMASGKVTCSVIFDGQSNTGTVNLFPIGTSVLLDLQFTKTSPIGYPAVPAIVSGFSPGVDFEGKGTAEVECELNGVPPAFGTIT